MRATETYLPYFAIGARFDSSRARAALGPAIAPAPLGDYFDVLVDYALRARWGADSSLTRATATSDTAACGQAAPALARS